MNAAHLCPPGRGRPPHSKLQDYAVQPHLLAPTRVATSPLMPLQLPVAPRPFTHHGSALWAAGGRGWWWWWAACLAAPNIPVALSYSCYRQRGTPPIGLMRCHPNGGSRRSSDQTCAEVKYCRLDNHFGVSGGVGSSGFHVIEGV